MNNVDGRWSMVHLRKPLPLCDTSALTDGPTGSEARPEASGIITDCSSADPRSAVRTDEIGSRWTNCNIDAGILSRGRVDSRAIPGQLRTTYPRLSSVRA